MTFSAGTFARVGTFATGTFACVGVFAVDVAFVEAFPAGTFARVGTFAAGTSARVGVFAVDDAFVDFSLLGKASPLRLRRNRRVLLAVLTFLLFLLGDEI